MNFKDRLLRRVSPDDESAWNPLALSRFSFEDDEHARISTERLFQQWQQDNGTQYNTDTDDQIMEETKMKKEKQDIIARMPYHPPRPPLTLATDYLGRPPRS
jgi:hypothetical protein